jgi:hypothetical protein
MRQTRTKSRGGGCTLEQRATYVGQNEKKDVRKVSINDKVLDRIALGTRRKGHSTVLWRRSGRKWAYAWRRDTSASSDAAVRGRSASTRATERQRAKKGERRDRIEVATKGKKTAKENEESK